MEVIIKITVDENGVTVETETNWVKSEVIKEEALINPFREPSVMFNEDATGWSSNQDYNRMFLSMAERNANDMLRAQGYLFMNEVYTMLGLPRTKLGCILGWVYDEKNPIGDNFVDFGLYEPRNAEFLNGNDNAVLSFNVDGIILDYVK